MIPKEELSSRLTASASAPVAQDPPPPLSLERGEVQQRVDEVAQAALADQVSWMDWVLSYVKTPFVTVWGVVTKVCCGAVACIAWAVQRVRERFFPVERQEDVEEDEPPVCEEDAEAEQVDTEVVQVLEELLEGVVVEASIPKVVEAEEVVVVEMPAPEVVKAPWGARTDAERITQEIVEHLCSDQFARDIRSAIDADQGFFAWGSAGFIATLGHRLGLRFVNKFKTALEECYFDFSLAERLIREKIDQEKLQEYEAIRGTLLDLPVVNEKIAMSRSEAFLLAFLLTLCPGMKSAAFAEQFLSPAMSDSVAKALEIDPTSDLAPIQLVRAFGLRFFVSAAKSLLSGEMMLKDVVEKLQSRLNASELRECKQYHSWIRLRLDLLTSRLPLDGLDHGAFIFALLLRYFPNNVTNNDIAQKLQNLDVNKRVSQVAKMVETTWKEFFLPLPEILKMVGLKWGAGVLRSYVSGQVESTKVMDALHRRIPEQLRRECINQTKWLQEQVKRTRDLHTFSRKQTLPYSFIASFLFTKLPETDGKRTWFGGAASLTHRKIAEVLTDQRMVDLAQRIEQPLRNPEQAEKLFDLVVEAISFGTLPLLGMLKSSIRGTLNWKNLEERLAEQKKLHNPKSLQRQREALLKRARKLAALPEKNPSEQDIEADKALLGCSKIDSEIVGEVKLLVQILLESNSSFSEKGEEGFDWADELGMSMTANVRSLLEDTEKLVVCAEALRTNLAKHEVAKAVIVLVNKSKELSNHRDRFFRLFSSAEPLTSEELQDGLQRQNVVLHTEYAKLQDFLREFVIPLDMGFIVRWIKTGLLGKVDGRVVAKASKHIWKQGWLYDHHAYRFAKKDQDTLYRAVALAVRNDGSDEAVLKLRGELQTFLRDHKEEILVDRFSKRVYGVTESWLDRQIEILGESRDTYEHYGAFVHLYLLGKMLKKRVVRTSSYGRKICTITSYTGNSIYIARTSEGYWAPMLKRKGG